MFGWQPCHEAVRREIETDEIRFLRRELGISGLILFQHRATNLWGIGWKEGNMLKELKPLPCRGDGYPYLTREIVGEFRRRMRPRDIESERSLLAAARRRHVAEYDELNEMDDNFRADARKTFRGKFDDHPSMCDLSKHGG